VARVIVYAVGGVLAVVLLIAAAAGGVVAAIFGGNGAATGEVCLGTVTNPGATLAGLSAEQARNAGVIVAVGERMKVPVRGWVIAIATALQESDLINSRGGDQDSLGLFQQRPSQGWGTPEQIMSPDYAATKFYEHLLRVPGWQTMPLTQAAQAVQRSAYPDAYTKHEPRATEIVKAYIGGTLPACDPVAVSAAGWTRPVPGPIVSGFRTPERPEHDGIDIGAPRGTVIRTASAGVVVTVLCNVAGNTYPPTGGPLPCDSDGNPGLSGCGWYVQIRHHDSTVGDIVSRYCHMLRQPGVRVGQTVTAGQPIGIVGSSGNSSGPHLHFEIHAGYPATRDNAIEPRAFMAAHGVPM
jgi:murein DD-endopeptidase MepM/ murein hydrolase activator NlpD